MCCLQSNAVERRTIFEEAAGISRFKARKKEAIRKLERTERNLELVRQRLEDTERRLRSVKMQAARARSYQEHTAKLRRAAVELRAGRVSTSCRPNWAELSELLEQAEADRAAAARQLHEHEQAVADAELERKSILVPAEALWTTNGSNSRPRKDQARQRINFARSSSGRGTPPDQA